MEATDRQKLPLLRR